MKVLVTAASRYGATTEIAQAIGETLMGAGHDVDVRPPEEVASVDAYECVVAGSAVYAGRWLESGKKMIIANSESLHSRRVWLFSSGPLGDPPKPEEVSVDVAELMEASGAVAHQVFAGKLDRKRLRFAERAIVRALRAPEGDFRDWDEIRSWARNVADELSGYPGNAGA